jgi:hypothetical protein
MARHPSHLLLHHPTPSNWQTEVLLLRMLRSTHLPAAVPHETPGTLMPHPHRHLTRLLGRAGEVRLLRRMRLLGLKAGPHVLHVCGGHTGAPGRQ